MVESEWWRGAVVYQVYPRSFMDSNGDGVGDLAGITQKLDYIAHLGVDAIWISPFVRSPMKDFGYDVSDYCDVDPLFGDLDNFKALLDKAHSLGLKILMDQVWAHTSDQHVWFKESRRDRINSKHDWYVWADPKPDGTAPNNWLSYFGGPAWTWDSRREQYYLNHFLKEQPALNSWNPEVRQAIKDTAKFWLDMGVDGFRLDVAHGYLSDRFLRDNPPRPVGEPMPTDLPTSNPMARQLRIHSMCLPENLEWIEELSAYINQWPDRCLLGEAGGDNSEQVAVSYTQTGKRFSMAYSFGLVGSHMTHSDISKTVDAVEGLIGDGWLCWAVSNHDFKRAASRLEGDVPLKDKALFATVLGLCLRGSYCLYQGEELGLPQAELAFEDIVDPYDRMLYPEHVGRDGCRTPMPWISTAPHAGFSTADRPWLPVSPAHNPLAVDVQEEDGASALHYVRAFLQWRKGKAALRTGDFSLLESHAPVFAFKRTGDGQDIVCVFNCSDRKASVAMESLGVSASALLPLSYNALPSDSGALDLEPFGFAFFS